MNKKEDERIVTGFYGGVHIYAPTADVKVGKEGRKCVTCTHYAMKQKYDGWSLREDCPCFECAGMGYSFDEDLFGWTNEPIEVFENILKAEEIK